MDRRDTLLLACGAAETRRSLRPTFEESYNLLEADNLHQMLMLVEQNHACLAAILLDITSRDKLGSDVLDKLSQIPYIKSIPVITLTADSDPVTLGKLFSMGAADVIPLDYDPFAMQRRIHNIAELNMHKLRLEELVAEQAAILRHSNEGMVDALSSIIEYRSVESGQHIFRIRHFTRILLEEVAHSCPEYDLTHEAIGIISRAAALHDIGKISIPDSILNKPGKLTDDERAVMQTHSLTGSRILETLEGVVEQEYLRYAHNICHYHHERWDGSGYPEGIYGDNIPICAQVVGLADVYDALTNTRVYKNAIPHDNAVNMILQGECGLFSPKLLECFKHVLPQFRSLAEAYADGLLPKSDSFDAGLPTPSSSESSHTLDIVQMKYLALIHYLNAFLLELDPDRTTFHILYNPYPELSIIQSAKDRPEAKQRILAHLVLPEDKERMGAFLSGGIEYMLQTGARRHSAIFRLYNADRSGFRPFELTFLRPSPNNASQKKLIMLWRALDEDRLPAESHTVSSEEHIFAPPDGYYCCRYDRDFTLESSGLELSSLLGYSPEELEELFSNRLIALVPPEDQDSLRRSFAERLSTGSSASIEYRLIHKDGHIVWVHNKAAVVMRPDGNEYLYGTLTDISESKRAYDDIRTKMDRYEIILAQTENVLFEWDIEADTISFSDTWEKIFGYTPINSNVREAINMGSFFHPDDIPLLLNGIRALEDNLDYQMLEVRISTSNGRYMWCRFRATALRDQSGNLKKISGIIINIDSEKRAEQALLDKAERDSLTNLLNKNAARKHAEEYFSQNPNGANCAMLIIDLDNFKEVNDQFGHMFGDVVLTQISREIKKLFRMRDMIARIGGDEFMVIMRDISDPALVKSRCNLLVSSLRELFRTQLYNCPLSCSIGVAMSPMHGSSYVDLFQHADQALYQAKSNGKNQYKFYDSTDPVFRPKISPLTNANTRIDSDEDPGILDTAVIQSAFRRLYSSDDVAPAINEILNHIGRQTNVSRVYIFENSLDDKYCNNTYEWCNTGVTPEIDNLQNISYETDIPGYEDNFDEHGIYYCPDVREMPPAAFEIVDAQGIKSMLQYAIREGGKFRGYIGLDDCNTYRMWTKEQIDILSYFAEMLGVFLLKKRAQDALAQRVENLTSILDSQSEWIYVIDPDTCELKHLNKNTRSIVPDAKPGMLCHKILMGLDERCPGCPAQGIYDKKNNTHVMVNEVLDLTVLSEASAIKWDGRDACLIVCRPID